MCYNMDKLKDILLSDISQGESQIMYGIISMWNLKENKSQFHKNREQNVDCQWLGGEGNKKI